MFEFTTQSVYNDIIKSEVSTGQVPDKGANLIVTTGKTPAIRIGNTRFTEPQIQSIEVKAPSEESLAKVTFDLSKIIAKIPEDVNEITGRIGLYIGLSMNSQDSFYANDFVYKGKPFFIEFPVKSTTTAKDVKKIVDKYMLLMTDEKILNVVAGEDETGNDPQGDDNSEMITFEGVNGYQQIRKAVLQWYNPEAKSVDCCTNQGDYETIVTGVPVIWTIGEDGKADAGDTEKVYDGITEGGRNLDSDTETAILPGLEAFGDYNWIIHNLRLPTLANTYFWSPTKNEMPIPGASYTQFIITMRDINKGTAGNDIGQVTTCQTTHVLYVIGKYDSSEDSPAKTVYTALNTLASSKIATTADDNLEEPFA